LNKLGLDLQQGLAHTIIFVAAIMFFSFFYTALVFNPKDTADNLKKSGPVFGITVLRRLVPGWFIKGDLGNDIINLGFAIEF
jgi:hypothetical protein